MGLDGFSIANLGLNKNLTSAQLANEAEATARQSLENQIADVDGVGKREKVGKKDEDAAFNGFVPFIGEPKEKDENEDGDDESTEETENSSDIETTENENSADEEDDEDADKYHFKYNENNMIEVWDSKKKEIIKTISPEDAANVFSSFSKVPGIFVNKKV